jgi:hypothetical protein
MAVAASIRVTGAEALVAALQRKKVPPKDIEAAVRRGADITVKQLAANSPIGPTGNLQRAAAVKTVTYESGTVVAVIGYRRAGAKASVSAGGSVSIGPDRAYHQYWIEEGTDSRKLLNGSVASNIKAFGAAGNEYFAARGRGGKAGWSGAVVVFRPRDGQLGKVTAQHPMLRAYEQTKDAAASAIEQELAIALTAAMKGGAGV